MHYCSFSYSLLQWTCIYLVRRFSAPFPIAMHEALCYLMLVDVHNILMFKESCSVKSFSIKCSIDSNTFQVPTLVNWEWSSTEVQNSQMLVLSVGKLVRMKSFCQWRDGNAPGHPVVLASVPKQPYHFFHFGGGDGAAVLRGAVKIRQSQLFRRHIQAARLSWGLQNCSHSSFQCFVMLLLPLSSPVAFWSSVERE